MNEEQEIQIVRDFIDGKDTTEKVAVIIYTIKEIEGVMNLKEVTMCVAGEDAFNNDNKLILRRVAIGMAVSLGVAEESLKGEAR